jgi:hypothetical protein
MTTATETTIRVPVRTWKEKAILASVLSRPLAGLREGFNGYVGGVHEHLSASTATDELIDGYFAGRPEIESIEAALRSLRQIAPGPDATLEVPASLSLLEVLDDEIQHLVTTDVEELLKGPYPSRRELAAATIVAIDLRDELAGGDA